MPWVRFDDLFPLHRKVRGLSDSAFRLHVEAIFWCARNLTDGFVSAEDVSDVSTVRRPHKSLPELVRRDMWIEREGGWDIHDYFDYQPSKAKVLKERRAKAERQSRWMAKRRPKDASTDATQDSSRDAAPPRPEQGGERGHPERQPSASTPHGAGRDRRNKEQQPTVPTNVKTALERARADPRQRCHHGTDAGLYRRPDTGLSPCALCRTETQEAS